MLQWLDDLDDWVGALGLLAEKIRSGLLKLVAMSALVLVLGLGVVLAQVHAPMATAIATLLFLGLLNKSVLEVA